MRLELSIMGPYITMVKVAIGMVTRQTIILTTSCANSPYLDRNAIGLSSSLTVVPVRKL